MKHYLYILLFIVYSCASSKGEENKEVTGVWVVNEFKIESEVFSKNRKFPELKSTIMSLEFNFKEDSNFIISQNSLSNGVRAKMSLSENQIQEPRGRYVLKGDTILLYRTIDYFGAVIDTLFILDRMNNEMVLKQKHDMFNIIYSVSKKK